MMIYRYLLLLVLLSAFLESVAQAPFTNRKTPIMGWSSWNNFDIRINEQLIKRQADAMVTTGMKAAGYSYINIDDGFFGGRDSLGNIRSHPDRFPGGMKKLAAYIHSRGLKAGIYSDAGINTCASQWNGDTIGVGMGLFGHEYQDLNQMLVDWNYDFIKVDWCGGALLGLDEQESYTRIGKFIRQLRPNTIYNVCRWQFPGSWVGNIADSWRISGDINNKYESILRIIDLNADLWKYAGPGHVNDMDMLQVGRGMSYEEDKSHFSMWCMMASPLLAGNDLTAMSKQTIAILTNAEMIAIDQDPLVYQARRVADYGDQEVWARPLGAIVSGKIAVALLNRANVSAPISVNVDSLGVQAAGGYAVRNIWDQKTLKQQTAPILTYQVAPHGVVVLLLTGKAVPYNVFEKK